MANSVASIFDATAKPSMTHEELKSIEGGLLLISADSVSGLTTKLQNLSFEGPSFDEDPCGRRLSSELFSASQFNKT